MAGKAIVPFIEASSTFAFEGEPSPANLALAAMEVEQEAKLNSVKDDYDTLRRGLGIKIECLEKRVEKGSL